MSQDDYAKKIKRLEEENKNLKEEIKELQNQDELDRERTRLAGCLVAAEGNAVGPNDCKKGDFGWSPAFEAVKELRKKYEESLKERRCSCKPNNKCKKD